MMAASEEGTEDGSAIDRPTAEKRALRARLRPARAAVVADADQAATAGRLALGHILDDARWRAARRVGLFAAVDDEPETRPLFQAAIEIGRTLLLPRCIEGNRLEFAEVSAWDDLRPGRYGLAEPPPSALPLNTWQAGDLVILPGVAFDSAGGRLGRGQGYYDRSFEGCARGAPWLLGFAFEFQLVESVPMETLDRRVDGVLTEVGLSWHPGAES